MRRIRMTVTGDQVSVDSSVAGVQGSGNVDVLEVRFDAAWDGFAKTATWWNALGREPVKRTLTADLLVDLAEDIRRYAVPIPAEALSAAGMCQLVIDGYQEGRRARSVCVELEVLAAPVADDAADPVDPTPSQAEQLQGQVDHLLEDLSALASNACDARDKAVEAQATAEEARDRAESAAGYAREQNNLAAAWCVAAQNARDAARAAQAAAESAAVKAPCVGENGSWQVWDVQAGAYVDSGRPARGADGVPGIPGEPGKSPCIGENGNWYVWDAAEAEYADSGVAAQGPAGTGGGSSAESEQWAARSEFLLNTWANGGDRLQNDAIDQTVPAEKSAVLRREKVQPRAIVWEKFMQSVMDYYEAYNGAGFRMASYLNDEVIRDVLLLRGDPEGGEIRSEELFNGEPETQHDLIIRTIDAVKDAANGSAYVQNWAMVRPLSWYEFQYALIHREELAAGAAMPGEAACREEAERLYLWMYEDILPDIWGKERQVNNTTWTRFIQAAGDYFDTYSGSAFTFPLTDEVLRDDLLLRLDLEGDTIAAADFFKGDPENQNDLLIETMNALERAFNSADYIDPGTCMVHRPLTWYQFQYCLIHRNTLLYIPSDEECKAECWKKYVWKYQLVSIPKVGYIDEKPLDEAVWADFIRAAGAYYETYEGDDFTFPLTDDVLRDVLLLRGDNTGTESSAADFFKGDPYNDSDLITLTLDAVYGAGNGADYIDQGTVALIKPLTWAQFQYCLIHRDALSYVPSDEECKVEAVASYFWRYEVVGTEEDGAEAPADFWTRGGLYRLSVIRDEETESAEVIYIGGDQRFELAGVVFDLGAGVATNTLDVPVTVRTAYVPVKVGASRAEKRLAKRAAKAAEEEIAQTVAALEARIAALESAGTGAL